MFENLEKFKYHQNLERVFGFLGVRYLFKYCTKGPTRAMN